MCILHPSTQGQAECPPALINTATIPFRAWVFFPREGREPKLWSGRSTDHGILLQRALWLPKIPST